MAYVNVNASSSLPPFLHLLSGLTGQAYTMTCWVRDLSPSNTNHVVFYQFNGPAATATDASGLEGQADDGSGNHFFAGDVFAGPENPYTAPGVAYTGWVFVAFVSDGSGNMSVYMGTESIAVVPSSPFLTYAYGGGVNTDLYVAHPSQSFDANTKYASVKFWQTALTGAQVLAEQNSLAPAAPGAYTFLSCSAGTTVGVDQSGSGHDWTIVAGGTGTWTVDADLPAFPPVPPSPPSPFSPPPLFEDDPFLSFNF